MLCRVPSSYPVPNMPSQGAVQHDGPTNAQSCIHLCVITGGCVAVDYNFAWTVCWLHMDAANLDPDKLVYSSIVDHYQLYKHCYEGLKKGMGRPTLV